MIVRKTNSTYYWFLYLLSGMCLLCSTLPIQAQTTTYFCDFENAQERSQWTLNAGPQGSRCDNQWYIGQIGDFSPNGQNGLYISSDGGKNSVYSTATQSAVVAYRELSLQQGSYFLDFDWRALGLQNASIVVFWVPRNVATNSNPNGGYSSRTLEQYRLGGDTVLYGSITWQSIRMSINITADNANGKLVFIWSCAKNGVSPNLPAGCIDNISIIPYNSDNECEAPALPITYDKSTAVLSWKGQGGMYQVRDYNMENGRVVLYDSIGQNSVQLKTFTEGYHVFSVRTICGENSFSEWKSIADFIWIPGNRCIDYLDLAAAKCYYGTFEKPYENVGVVDKGYANQESRHTLHYVKGETDIRTHNQLSTIPEGEIASVRLGNWKNGAEAEAIEYQYTVQAGQSDIMELKYAIVMEKPGHSREENPHFLLDILDANGRQIGQTMQSCFKADFAASTREDLAGWEEWMPDLGAPYNDTIVWKPWTTLPISLRNYVGQTLTIRFTTKDCQPAGHWAYAYFTIGCRSGDLEGIACGDFDTDHFNAPEGFNYNWYEAKDPKQTPIGTDPSRLPYVDGNVMHIDKQDTCVYVVEVISKMGDGCSYSLVANPNPRFPVAEATGKERVENCTNYVDFTNASHIYFINRKDGSQTESKEPVEDVIWDFGDGYPLLHSTAATLTHEYPSTGGTFIAKAIASMSDGVCQDTAFITLKLPDLSAGTDTYIDRCVGESYTLPTGVVVTEDTTYMYGEKNQYGCDADSRIIVTFHSQKTDTVNTAICEGEAYPFEGQDYTTEGQYIARLTSVSGCDSLRVLNLTVYPKLVVDIEDTLAVCADEPWITIPYIHCQGRLDEVVVRFDTMGVAAGFDTVYTFLPDEEIRIAMPATITPRDYHLTLSFGSEECPLPPIQVVVRIRYAASVIEQKNDLIALLNDQYNGGFIWTGYQWYCNNVPVVGAETSYMVVGDEHIGDEFYCVLTREDGTIISTCPIVYMGGTTGIDLTTDWHIYPTLLQPSEPMHIRGEQEITIIDVLGHKVGVYRSSEPDWTIPAPAHSGMYIVLNINQIIARIIVQ